MNKELDLGSHTLMQVKKNGFFKKKNAYYLQIV